MDLQRLLLVNRHRLLLLLLSVEFARGLMRRCKHGLVQSGLIQIRIVRGALRASLRNRCLATHLGFRFDLVAVSENLLRRLFMLFLLLWQRPKLVQALLSNDADWRNSRRGNLCRLRTQAARAL